MENTMICMGLNPRYPSIFFRYSSLFLIFLTEKLRRSSRVG